MVRLCFIKKDKEIARLRQGNLVKGGGVYINYLLSPGDSVLAVAIRVGRCHRRAVERNKIRRRIKEILRFWLKVNADLLKGKRLSLLINVGIKDKEADFGYLKQLLSELLEKVIN